MKKILIGLFLFTLLNGCELDSNGVPIVKTTKILYPTKVEFITNVSGRYIIVDNKMYILTKDTMWYMNANTSVRTPYFEIEYNVKNNIVESVYMYTF